MTATRLEGLQIDEISGVDLPANEVPGWLVLKSATVEEIEKERREIHEDLDVALEQVEPYLGDAPEDVQAAAETLAKHVRGRLADRVRGIFRKEQDLDMTNDELNEILDERDERILSAVTEQVDRITKSVQDALAEPGEATEAETVAKAEVEAVNTAVEELKQELETEREAHEATREALVKAFERLEAIEKRFISRTSLPEAAPAEEGEVQKSKQTGSTLAGALSSLARTGEAFTVTG